ncbi:transmembrane protease serine 9 [Ooceraea biroi]|uniref:transmembrane protease serine 9 n=1 Tax=Ooceraea biroi TaxID=2015173 RepID=UPI000F097EDC|nr:transmembrane protease serine 9 [Ooceraea biroi]
MLIQCLLAAVLVFQASLATPFGLQPRITDGQDAEPGEFPHQVSIRWGVPPIFKYNHVCGGSILNERYVLTAAHCILRIGKLKVVAGKHYLTREESTQQEVDVEKAIVHENFKGGIAPFDIAVLKLKTPLVLNERVSAVKLPEQDQVRSGDAVVTGWGSISKGLRPMLPAVLQKATVPLLDNKSCLAKFPEGIIGKKPELFDTQICTDSAGEVAACSGDSGGPLVQFDNNSKTATQIGVVSWGVYPCGVSRSPSVYTRVPSYVNWINNVMNALDETSIKHSGFIQLTPHFEMDSKLIVVFALLAVAFAEKPYLGFRMHFPISSQVVGGSDAPKGGYPYIVSLQWGQTKNSASHFCAGSILNSQWIVTAAHCTQAVPSYGVFLIKAGKHNIKTSENNEQVIEVNNYIEHEQYRGGVGPYDIALIKLKSPLTLTNDVQTIELAEAESDPTGNAFLAGWGSTSRTRNPRYPDILQHAQLEYVDRTTCHEAVRRLTGSSPVHETNVCTGPLNGEKSACSGDSGGPLISRNGNKPVLTGIVSWGIIPCGTVGAPSVYTRTSKFNSWISRNMALY